MVLQWNVQEVCAWVERIDGIPNAAVASAFKENGITGCKLLGLSMEDLKTMGVVDSTRGESCARSFLKISAF